MRERIGDPKLQELFKEYNVSLQIERAQGSGLHIIRIIFPFLENLSDQRMFCEECLKPAKIITYSRDFDDPVLSGHGLGIRFENLSKYQVEGCLIAAWDDVTWEKCEDDIAKGKDTPETALYDRCLNDNVVPLPGQAEVENRVIEFIRKNSGITRLRMRPPLLSEVRTALSQPSGG